MTRARPGNAGGKLSAAGLTLIELLVVISILAITATIALRTTTTMVDQTRYDSSKALVGNIMDSIVGQKNLRQVDDTAVVNGFVADMGRLPRAWLASVAGTNALTLNELFQQMSGVPTYAMYPATSANLTISSNADSAVTVPAGWRGPYVRLPSGLDTFRDGWGSPVGNMMPVNTDDRPSLYTFPSVSNPAYSSNPIPTLAIAQNHGDPVAGVAISGPSYRQDVVSGTMVRDSTTSSLVYADLQSTLELSVRVVRTNDPSLTVLTSTLTNSFIIARVYGPNALATNGGPALDVAVQLAGVGTAFVTNNPTTIMFTPATNAYQGVLTPGPRVVRVQWVARTNATFVQYSAPTSVVLLPGYNRLSVVVAGRP